MSEDLLQENILLERRSVQVIRGTLFKKREMMCSTTEYVAQTHRVIHRTNYSWKKSTEEVLRIPPNITTEQALRQYVRKHRYLWLR